MKSSGAITSYSIPVWNRGHHRHASTVESLSYYAKQERTRKEKECGVGGGEGEGSSKEEGTSGDGILDEE